MDRTLLDTDIYSEILKGRNQVVARRAAEYEDHFGQFTISVITMAEIVKGMQKRGDVAEIDEFVLACNLIEVILLNPNSAVIAGIALAHDLTLATGNTRHFQRVVDLGFPLRLVNWRDEATG